MRGYHAPLARNLGIALKLKLSKMSTATAAYEPPSPTSGPSYGVVATGNLLRYKPSTSCPVSCGHGATWVGRGAQNKPSVLVALHYGMPFQVLGWLTLPF